MNKKIRKSLLGRNAYVTRLVKYLGQASVGEPEVAQIWAEEAKFRNQQMDNGQLAGISAEEVFERIRFIGTTNVMP